MSPNAYRWRRALGTKEPLSFNQLLTEHEVMHHWAQRKKQLAEEYAEVDAERKPTFGHWRANMIREAGANLRDGLMDWEMLAEWYPEMWTIGVLKSIGDSDVRDHHHPDLVLNLEETRNGNRPASIAIEVELTAKNVDTYAKHLATWPPGISVNSKTASRRLTPTVQSLPALRCGSANRRSMPASFTSPTTRPRFETYASPTSSSV